ncbi:hypothetical protein F4802DRAFT_539343 [Xylaria palmicola]|nr:hypothetical protein F4802DRAFT_539343 [Xylaria palmicola]
MGRTEPTVVKPPAAFRRDARAKRARATVNKVIPGLLSAHPRAQRGIERSELIVDPPPLGEGGHGKAAEANGAANGVDIAEARHGRRKRVDSGEEARHANEGNAHNIQLSEKSRLSNVSGPRISLCVADTLTAAHSLLDQGPPSPSRPHKRHARKGSSGADGQDAKAKVGILNMASPLSPGGGFLNGASSQEESLCMRTTLLPALRDEFYRLPELGVVYTPDVLVFRPTIPRSRSQVSAAGAETAGEDVLPKNHRWFVDVVSAAMLRLPEIKDGDGDGVGDGGGSSGYASPADRELVVRKMCAALRVFADKGCTRVVLGAWGCGAYRNPVSEIAGAWRRVLGAGAGAAADLDHQHHHHADGKGGAVSASAPDGGGRKGRASGKEKKSAKKKERETWGAFFEDVVFAIDDRRLATAFAAAFGASLFASLPGDGEHGHGHEHGSSSSMAGEEDEDPGEAARVSELREKIAQLEMQVEQARSPHLRTGLEIVLAGLRKQLPPGGDGEASLDPGQEGPGEPDDNSDELDKDD